MGSSNSTDYTKQLCFVQNLADDHFGDVEIYRNEQGKYIMKCTKSFITGDRRHLDFKKVLEFMRSTSNQNILPLLYLEQFHESNVCIEYEKVFVFTEYLNFSLKGLILNKKSIDEPEIWYLLKTMLKLIAELEKNDLSMEFSLNNIFLTLKGIPSVFLYHFCCIQKTLRLDELTNDCHGNQHHSSHTDENSPSNNQIDDSQLQYKPQNMYFSLGTTILQLINMQIIQQNDNKEEALEQIKNQLFTTFKKNQILGNIIKEILLQKAHSFKILEKIQALSQSQKIKISTQIRFNKFRYVVADDQKIQSKAKDLILSDKTLMDFKSRPLSAVNTPIYRLKQKDNLQGREHSSVRNKSIIEDKSNFFKKKMTVSRDKKNTEHQHQNHLESINNIQHLEKEQHQVSSNYGESRRKASSLLNNKQVNDSRKPSTNNHHQSKLSLISKRNVSNSKVQDSIQLNNYQSCQLQFQIIKNGQKQIGGDKKPQLSQFYSHKSSQHPTDTKECQAASQKMKQILNQEISQKTKQFDKTYEKIANNHTQNSLLYKKLNQFSQNNHCYEALKGKEKSKSFFNSNNDVAKPLNAKTQENHNQKKQQNNKQLDKSVLYKPFHTEHNITHSEQYSQLNDGLSQKLKNSIFGLSQTKEGQNKENSATLRESISNALDRSNFLSTLQMKKQKNNIKTKNITEKKDLILSDMFNSKSINSKNQSLCIDHSENSIKAFGSQQIVSTNNILKGSDTPRAFEKKKVKLKSDKLFYQPINQQQQTLTKNSNQPLSKVSTKFNEEDKQNRIENSQSRISHGNNSNGKLRRLSVRAKTNNLMAV